MVKVSIYVHVGNRSFAEQMQMPTAPAVGTKISWPYMTVAVVDVCWDTLSVAYIVQATLVGEHNYRQLEGVLRANRWRGDDDSLDGFCIHETGIVQCGERLRDFRLADGSGGYIAVRGSDGVDYCLTWYGEGERHPSADAALAWATSDSRI